MKRQHVPGCLWAADNLLVRTRKAATPRLPQTLLEGADAAGVACAVNLLSKEEFVTANTDTLFDPEEVLLNGCAGHQRCKQPEVFMSYFFWPEAGLLPTALQVRQALESIEDAHAAGLRVLVNGVGHPARAALVAGCWLAREGYGGDLEEERLNWLDDAHDPTVRTSRHCILNAAERAFVAEWPTGRENQPRLADMERTDQDEVFPFAPVEHWLRVLPTVRVYTAGRGKVRPMDAPVLGGQRVSDGANIDLDLEELRRGTWIGERTLRLTNGWQVVFVSPHA